MISPMLQVLELQNENTITLENSEVHINNLA